MSTIASRRIVSTAGVAARGQQVVRLGQRGVRRRDLVAVDGVHQPDDDRQLAIRPSASAPDSAARIGQPLQAGLDLVERAMRSARGDDQHVQRPALPRARVLDQPRAIGRGCASALR